ncbi:STAS domain-containing protein [Streptomyces sp. NPDC057939]|uniref:STAS domain-containing protein n=1 Tax=Streptomyces sp. NPDC057939 TaxID=3346284 RepID=UPI0036E13407
MNPPTGRPLHLTRQDTDDAVRIELQGELDHQDADTLLNLVTVVLAEPGRRLDLHLECDGITAIDSHGLSVLLMIRRHTDAAGVTLHLGNRPPILDRMLKVTGTLDHLTDRSASERPTSSTVERRSAASEKAIPSRSGGTDTTT